MKRKKDSIPYGTKRVETQINGDGEFRFLVIQYTGNEFGSFWRVVDNQPKFSSLEEAEAWVRANTWVTVGWNGNE